VAAKKEGVYVPGQQTNARYSGWFVWERIPKNRGDIKKKLHPRYLLGNIDRVKGFLPGRFGLTKARGPA
jgi:hypothetical protein